VDREDEIAEGLFLEELKSEYLEGLELKNSLDSKANNILTASIASSTLLIAIGTFLLSTIPLTTMLFGLSLSLFGAGIVFAVLAIFHSLKAFEIKGYVFAVKDNPFFDKEGNIITEKVNEYRFKKKTDFIGERISDYLVCLRFNIRKNQRKASKIRQSQLFFVVAISLITAFLIVLLTSVVIFAVRL
jgi:hypothetical protein